MALELHGALDGEPGAELLAHAVQSRMTEIGPAVAREMGLFMLRRLGEEMTGMEVPEGVEGSDFVITFHGGDEEALKIFLASLRMRLERRT